MRTAEDLPAGALPPTWVGVPGLALGQLVERAIARLPDGDPRIALVPEVTAAAAARFARAPVHTHLAVLIERTVQDTLARPDLPARARWRRRTTHELRLRKWDGSPGRRVPLRFERTDEYGRWYRWPAGEPMLPGQGPPEIFEHDFVQLVPATGAWTARWGEAGQVELYCDITTRPVLHGAIIAAVDLDLDVVRDHGGRVTLIDQDQFARRSTEMGYPRSLITQAQVTAGKLYTAISAAREPFATVGAHRLADRPTPTARSDGGP